MYHAPTRLREIQPVEAGSWKKELFANYHICECVAKIHDNQLKVLQQRWPDKINNNESNEWFAILFEPSNETVELINICICDKILPNTDVITSEG